MPILYKLKGPWRKNVSKKKPRTRTGVYATQTSLIHSQINPLYIILPLSKSFIKKDKIESGEKNVVDGSVSVALDGTTGVSDSACGTPSIAPIKLKAPITCCLSLSIWIFLDRMDAHLASSSSRRSFLLTQSSDPSKVSLPVCDHF